MTCPVILSWSGGKDSMMALDALRRDDRYTVAGLLTTLTEGYDRISMHGVRRSLLHRQAHALELPLHEIFIPQQCTSDDYRERMRTALQQFKDSGIDTIAHGDLFLEDIRAYREENLAQLGMTGLFPLWLVPTGELARTFIDGGYRAITVCTDGEVLDERYVGRDYDEAFIASLPAGADVCGENGEFHTFVYDGPHFARPVPFTIGDKVLRDARFWYCDLLEEK
jgi:uncharacterized protein (TIGR00290 family)